tara:strand:- start:4634 stop:5662 length:1029 start_codon:yes stop_codon:yes gene_type:complete
MALPKQVQEQIEAAKAHYEQVDEPVTEANQPTNAADDASEGAYNEANNVRNEANSALAEHTSAEPDPYEHRYKTLQGMYNADKSRWQQQASEVNARNTQLEQLLATLSAQSQTSTQAQKPVEHIVSDTEREEYGESISVMRKVSQEELRPLMGKVSQIENAINQLMANLNTQIVPQVQQVVQQQAISQEDRFWQNLASNVPNWQQINNDREFHSWLLDTDPLTGTTRQSHLELAQRNLNAPRVAAFFSTFVEQTGKYKPNASAQPNRSAQATELEKQVAPGKGRSNNAAASGKSEKTYSPSDIRKFFDDVRAGKYKGREAERNRLERDIFAAQQENRIVANA